MARTLTTWHSQALRHMSGRGTLRMKLSRERLYFYGPALTLTLVAFLIALHFVRPAPPRQVVMATGARDGAYYQFGLRYQTLLAREGIQLDVRETAGAIEN